MQIIRNCVRKRKGKQIITDKNKNKKRKRKVHQAIIKISGGKREEKKTVVWGERN